MSQRFREWLNVTLVSVGVGALVLVCAELAARLYEAPGDSIPLANLSFSEPGQHPIIASRPWGPEYLEDLRNFHWRQRYAPFVGFRSIPHSGSSINVDADGQRRTLFNSSDASALLLYACGGSTMIGIGAPDWGTIPSYLAREINRGGGASPVRIENRAQVWWTSGQALMDLIVALQNGERPDVVLFYDGINDFSVVSYGGRPGGIAPYAGLLLEDGLDRLWSRHEPGTLETLRLPRLARRLLGLPQAAAPDRVSQRIGRRVPPPGEVASLLREAASIYAANVRIVRSLGVTYGFESYFFLQPFPLFSAKPLTAEEEPVVRSRRMPWEQEQAESFYALVRRSAYLRSLPEFIDISTVLDDVVETLLLDIEHLLPRGNELVAQAMLERLRRIRAPFLGAAPAPRGH